MRSCTAVDYTSSSDTPNDHLAFPLRRWSDLVSVLVSRGCNAIKPGNLSDATGAMYPLLCRFFPIRVQVPTPAPAAVRNSSVRQHSCGLFTHRSSILFWRFINTYVLGGSWLTKLIRHSCYGMIVVVLRHAKATTAPGRVLRRY